MGLNIKDIETLKSIGINMLVLLGVAGLLIWVSIVSG